jgi:hypothetical protein
MTVAVIGQAMAQGFVMCDIRLISNIIEPGL